MRKRIMYKYIILKVIQITILNRKLSTVYYILKSTVMISTICRPITSNHQYLFLSTNQKYHMTKFLYIDYQLKIREIKLFCLNDFEILRARNPRRKMELETGNSEMLIMWKTSLSLVVNRYYARSFSGFKVCDGVRFEKTLKVKLHKKN